MRLTRNRWIRRIGIAAGLVAAFALGLSLRGGAPGDHREHATGADATTIWTCSMHPQIHLPNPGQCPICGMDLIPLEASTSGDEAPRTLTLSPAARAIAEIQTTRVERRPVQTTLRMVGKLEADETRIREISARVPGRIDKLYIDYTGVPVRSGQALFDLYSPELYSAQEELVQAIKASEQLERSGLESTRRSATRTIAASRERLRLWGLTEEQIKKIETRATPSDLVTIVAPMSGIVLHKQAIEGSYVKTGTHVYAIADLSVLWLKLDVYESDLAWVSLDQKVTFETDAFPGERLEGTVSFIDPVLDQRSRSVKMRVNVKNSDGRLKPGMFARASVHAAVRGDNGTLPLVIPASAPLVTGTRAVVYVADAGQPGRYVGREVVLGPEADGFFVVRDGLVEGEYVVSNGTFKIDSALQIQAKSSMMNPEGGGPTPGHEHHGGAAATVDSEQHEPSSGKNTVPQAFRLQFDEVLGAYFELGDALSHDDLEAAQSAARALPAALDGVDRSLLAAARASWDEARKELAQTAGAVADAADLAAARDAFFHMSLRLITAVRTFGASGRTPVFVYHCPMARDGAGADWLQRKVGTENPYYGSQMFRCGSRTETLVAGSQDTETGHDNH